MAELNNYSARNTCDKINRRLVDYIKSEYLGKHDQLRKICSPELENYGALFNEPYFEASPAYSVLKNGLENASISEESKSFLIKMAEGKMGVFASPYVHQINALENFSAGNDILVATGTGSGKTECFMWPIASKLFAEAKNNAQSWAQRGVRVLMLYPMNALVSDQLGRMRNMLGTAKFRSLFRSESERDRIPTFGMYTSRTKYTGTRTAPADKKVAAMLRKEILNRDQRLRDKLVEMGRCPAKDNLESYVRYLESDNPGYSFENDSEYFLRWEMQNNPPDVLITNYSMLEYLLFRPHERGIWEKTKLWLDEDPANKLLFVIDEAHMYRGAAGGEVSLLVRRVLNRLGIPRNRVQFILTTASVPKDHDEEVISFARNLTSGDGDTTFKIISGEFDKPPTATIFLKPEKLSGFDIDSLENETTIFGAVKDLLLRVGFKEEAIQFDSKETMEKWLYDNLSQVDVVSKLLAESRGHARKYGELVDVLFPNVDTDVAYHALDSILALVPFAKNTDGRVLIPTKLHLIYRGLRGIYACINPRCPESSINGLGKIYLNTKKDRCDCGGRIYELVNHRNCGALYLKGYMEKTPTCDDFIWSGAGKSFDSNLREVHFYILSGTKPKTLNGKVIWADSKTGKIRTDDNCTEEDGYIHLMYKTEEIDGKPNMLTFNHCPKCNLNASISDFATKGNDPFFNIVSQQLSVQPPSLFSDEEIKETPNEGRKVLLFSDSRKNAANLAKNLSDLSISEAIRASIVVASRTLSKWAEENDFEDVSLDYLYSVLLKIIYDNSLNLFFENDEKHVEEDLENVKKYLEDIPIEEVKYNKVQKRSSYLPNSLKVYLLRDLCSDRRNLMDLSLGWVEPTDEFFEEMLDDSGFEGEKLEEFRNLIITWINFTLQDSYSLSYYEESLEMNVPRFGIKDDVDLLNRYRKFLIKQGWSEKELTTAHDQLSSLLMRKDSLRYIDAGQVKLNCSDVDWYKCPECNFISPILLHGVCSNCLECKPLKLESFDHADFLRRPVIEAINGSKAPLKIINVEEHTAQLSYKDQDDDMYSTTEDFELRFQNVYVDKKKPVDILSCTTTMEVGIDIGSLTAVGLRNVPPSRENYQQRAGRAGRRSASISTIVTYSDMGRFDHYFFEHPDEMISGNPRMPWIDADNEKILARHVFISILTAYFVNIQKPFDKTSMKKYFDEYYEDCSIFFADYIERIKDGKENDIVPGSKVELLKTSEFLEKVQEYFDLIKVKYDEAPDILEKLPLLDFCYENALIPTYSFPRDVIGFSVYKVGDEISVEEMPQRDLNQALSEYVPGRELTINKKTYLSGAVSGFNPITKKPYPTSKMLERHSVNRKVYECTNPSCSWFGLEETDSCPFCGEETEEKTMVVPWGFSPLNGVTKRECPSEARANFTYAQTPCYSTVPMDPDMIRVGKRIRYEKRANQDLVVMNTGLRGSGFTMCKWCGATIVGDPDTFQSMTIRDPFNRYCKHGELLSTYFGHNFRTDMMVFEIELDPNRIESRLKEVWIRQAAVTLSEAICNRAGYLLDVESNDICSGYRIIDRDDRHVVEIYMYDSLSSGAGYSSEIALRSKELLEATREYLIGCNCDSSCYKCLRNYQNRMLHDELDRHAALELLDWALYEKLPEPIPLEEQQRELQPLKEILDIPLDKVYVYPSAWSRDHPGNAGFSIKVPKIKVEKMPPLTYAIIKGKAEN